MKTLRILLSLTIPTFACSGGGVVLKESTTTSIGPRGGVTKSADGLLELRLPEGAVAQSLEVTIETDRDRQLTGLASPIYKILPRGLDFDVPVQIIVQTQDENVGLGLIQGGDRTMVSSCQPQGASLICDLIDDPSTEVALFDVQAPPRPTMGGREVVSVHAGGYWTCAHHGDQTMTCWGAIRNVNTDIDSRPYPTGAFTKVYDAHYHHTCAMRASGEVECFGKLGDIEFGQEPPPGTLFSKFSVGAFHNCGLLMNGSIECYGHADYGQLIAPAGTFKAIDSGITHSCAIRADDTLACWGELGQSVSAAAVAPSGTFQSLDLGEGGCAQRFDGNLECWGDGLQPTPTGGFDSYSVGTGVACGLQPGNVLVCWGRDQGAYRDLMASSSTFVSVSAGFGFVCGLTTTGQVECGGRNDFGQIVPPASF